MFWCLFLYRIVNLEVPDFERGDFWNSDNILIVRAGGARNKRNVTTLRESEHFFGSVCVRARFLFVHVCWCVRVRATFLPFCVSSSLLRLVGATRAETWVLIGSHLFSPVTCRRHPRGNHVSDFPRRLLCGGL